MALLHRRRLTFTLLMTLLVVGAVEFGSFALLSADIDETVYIDTCCHVNHRGRVAVAKAIASALASGEHE